MPDIAYIVIREDLFSPVVTSQCLDVIQELNRKEGKDFVRLIWFYRIDFLFRQNYGLKFLRQQLSERGIELTAIPFLSAGFPVSWWLLPLILPQWLLGLIYVRFILSVRSFHCRSYHAGLAVLALSIIFDVKLFFDPRSPFPEENITSGRWMSTKSINYRVWKAVETLILRRSNRVFLVSEQLKDYYKKEISANRIIIVPNNYPADFETNRASQSHQRHHPIRLIYVGSFGHWNSYTPYLRLISDFKKMGRADIGITFCTPVNNHAEIIDSLPKYELGMDKVNIKYVQQNQIFPEITSCTAGIYLMNNLDPRLGIKTVEYLRAGIPVIVSESIQGASSLVKQNKLGVTYDGTSTSLKEVVRFLDKVNDDKGYWKILCEDYAINHFSPSAVAYKLSISYKDSEEYIC